MTHFVKLAKQIIDLDYDNSHMIEVKYDKYIEGFGYETFTDYFKTNIIAPITRFEPHANTSIRYEKFLDTCIDKTTETRRKMVSVQLENLMLENNNPYSLIRIMNCIKILDPSFIPPLINVSCGWQKRMMREFCLTTLPKVIETCTSDYRLEKLFRVLQLIESDTLY
tara:strand:+ start:1432 stop:1932 length:501 start_codon:yes stop_codon:yes gene_type:complete